MAELNVRVGLKDNATKPLQTLSNRVKNFANEFKKATPHVEKTTASVLRLATGIAVGNIAVLALRRGLQELGQQFKATVDAANEMQSAMIGLSSVTAAFGEDTGKATQAAQDLAEDGLLAVTEAAEGLKNLLATGFNLEESIQLMEGFKDAAAFNRQGTLDFGQAIVGATQGIKNQNSIMVDNVGITKNLSVIMKEAGLKVEDMGRIATDTAVRQKFLNGILKEAEIFAGDAARAASTFQGAQNRLKTAVFELRASIGSALLPALSLLFNAFADNARSINEVIGPALEALAIRLVKAVTFLRQLGATAVAVGKSIFTFSIEPLRELGSTLETISTQGAASIKRIQETGLRGFADISRDAIERIVNTTSEAARKIREAIEKENERFQLSLAKQARQFEESLRDLVISHREKTEQLEDDIDEENETFKERMDERVEDFDKAMKLMEERHEERVKTIEEQIKKEQKKLEDQLEDITDKNKDQLEQFKIAGQERLNDLQRKLDTELSRGKLANNKRIAGLKKMLAKEKVALANQAKVREGLINKEKQKIIDERQERIDDLEDELQEEKADIIEAREEKESEYEKETAKIRREHDKRVAALKERLSVEIEIQKKFAEDFARFQDVVREDDITRLKRKFAEENKLMEEEHQRRLRDISKRSQEEAATRQAAQVRTDVNRQATISNEVRQAEEQVKITGGNLTRSVEQNFPSIFEETPTAVVSAQPTGVGFFEGISQGISNIAQNIFGGIKGFFGFQEGGDFTVGGQGGADSQLVAFRATPGERVSVRTPEQANGRGITLNMPVQIVSSEVDIDLVAERLMFKLNKGGFL